MFWERYPHYTLQENKNPVKLTWNEIIIRYFLHLRVDLPNTLVFWDMNEFVSGKFSTEWQNILHF